ncbi:MAG: bacterioferritin-associated ferredoxin [Pseudomonadales bacterium]|nr:bacterioferritin-associated ferredoxin [Pseudomonadales bacterium]
MYVCICKGITDNQIREAVGDGCDSLRDLRRELGVGSQCGKCARHARHVLREARSANEVSSFSHSSGGEAVVFWPQTA